MFAWTHHLIDEGYFRSIEMFFLFAGYGEAAVLQVCWSAYAFSGTVLGFGAFLHIARATAAGLHAPSALETCWATRSLEECKDRSLGGYARTRQ